MWNSLSTFMTDIEAISIATIASALSMWLGGSESLLVLIQYLFLADSILLVCARTPNIPQTKKLWLALKKYASLYLSVVLVGIGTKAFDVAIQDALKLTYTGSFFFDLFLYTLVVFELSSINRHLARMGFVVNKGLEVFFKAILKKVFKKADLKITDNEMDTLIGSTPEKEVKRE